MRIYRYVGSQAIAASVADAPAGTKVTEPASVLLWVHESGQCFDADGCVIATFVIDEYHTLRIADRHSEHVACAGGRSVMSAGEITFRISKSSVQVVTVSNQSTGYCPEPGSWPVVSNALHNAGLKSPFGFEPAFEFRRCDSCNSINLVKDNVFECAICNSRLAQEWNIS